MRTDHVRFLVCPECKSDLHLSEIKAIKDDFVEFGQLSCDQCGSEYPIIRHIPRFVPLENYASSFGFEWGAHAKTQYDSYSGAKVSEKRFFEETLWPRDLTGQMILEVGSGSGRFTEQAISTNGMIVSMDYSCAVEANYASNGKRDNCLIVQGDLYHMPFREESFDKLFCFGVLQHTPDVQKAFLVLPSFLKRGGEIAIDLYRKPTGIRQLMSTKYWFRPITKRMHPPLLYSITSRYIKLMWPLSKFINKLPFGKQINWALLVADYRGIYDLNEDILREWAILDTFDMLSPAYDIPQSLETVRLWFEQAKLTQVDVRYGFNGIEGRGKKT
jgi:ubiquinone/menaquinone biosynthesis C-methylase UbiE/uncharacterized protein YbaR (Trm112 family)